MTLNDVNNLVVGDRVMYHHDVMGDVVGNVTNASPTKVSVLWKDGEEVYPVIYDRVEMTRYARL